MSTSIMHCISRNDFLGEYEFPLKPKHDFKLNGYSAFWASDHPAQWGRETDSIKLPNIGVDGADRSNLSFTSAISGDSKLLAVSLDNAHILIYHIESGELRQELDGTGKMAFAPSPPKKSGEGGNVEVNEPGSPAAYTLVSGVADAGDQNTGTSRLVVWELDKHGRLLDEEEPVDASAFATKAIESITAQLKVGHEWSQSFIESSTLHADFERALEKVAANHRRRHNTTIDDATLASFGESPFSSDGSLMLYLPQNRYYENDGVTKRPPSVVVWDIKASKVLLRLSDYHTDVIMWTSFSPDNKWIATVSWDGTMRMHSMEPGAFTWVTPNSGGQAWTAAFTPDSKHIVWSSANGGTIQVHDVSDGRLVSTFQKPFSEWCRCLKWHPDGQQLAFCAGLVVYIWRPFDSPNGTITQHFELEYDEWHGFGHIEAVEWFEHGRKLALMSSEGSALVWDGPTNLKELFRRNKGAQVAWTGGIFYHISDEGRNVGSMYLSVDGDGKLRYWKKLLSKPARSWWDKLESSLPKREFPETGKYVKITKPVKAKEAKEVTDVKDKPTRDAWAEKGAELWTAE
ncbi:WD40 repeat-like protein [Melanomma pulvis-pyrius CBS 109.77]|uniref:WD40 repeat-like protein n=1 Tax=Melanomma pulvis-pyrius CBS 109.77 TaxID=1314802 RepID=A0A6A6XDE5_9PLEO|nr:WD40 repeat-like protein [Melanomma pulvis-pyrius CBS 109.77]